ncbi:MAG: tRNA (uridine(54)-C5)-methyltransferase TrmA, partial [Thiovulaceae bacterium]|nr:tRNA (uridine(54)-C5)-methyltransferase TrmA [Sulfurimonadaceae bacterium]
MTCDYFGECGSCTLHALDYEAQLEKKLEENRALFAPFYQADFDVIRSDSQAFRARAEFRLWHDDDGISYAMNNLTKDGMVLIDSCSIVTEPIAILMPKIIALVKEKRIEFKLFHVDFLSTTHGETVVSLLYHRKLDDAWRTQAQAIAKELDIHIIGRSRKQKVIIGQDFVTESLKINGSIYKFEHIENSFTQPNAKVNEKMIEWVLKQTANAQGDLLELYCGAGNFTLPMSKNFTKVLATEI